MEGKGDEDKQDLSNEAILLDEDKSRAMRKSVKKQNVEKSVSKLKHSKGCYSKETLQKALEEIRQGKKSIRGACREYSIPRGTVQDRLHYRVADGPPRKGPVPVMGIEGERKLCEYILHMTKIGFPVSTTALLSIVANLCKDTNQKTPFKDGIPGPKWIRSFLKRHPEISLRTPEAISKDRAIVTEEKIRQWFKNLREYLSESNALDILNSGDRVLNGDESGFALCPKTGKVLAPKGFRNVFQVTASKEKENITVLIVFTASGKVCPPLVVFPYIRPPRTLIQSIPKQWVLGRSESGWMRADIFYEYICNDFNKWLDENKIQRPVLLLVDGHKSHMTIPLSKFCEKNGIILYTLPPRTTHMLQPADVSVFKALKQAWQGTVRSFHSESHDPWNSAVTKFNFCPLFEQALSHLNMPELIKNGFRKCGLFPLNENAIDYTKCLTDTAKKQRNSSIGITSSEIDTAIKVIKYSNLNSKLGIDTNLIIKKLEAMKSKSERRKSTPKRKSPKKTTPELKTPQNNSCSPNVGSYVSLDDITVLPLDDMTLEITNNLSTDYQLALLNDIGQTVIPMSLTNHMGKFELETTSNINSTGHFEDLVHNHRQETYSKNQCDNIRINQENLLLSDICSLQTQKDINITTEDDNMTSKTLKKDITDSITSDQSNYILKRAYDATEINDIKCHFTLDDTSEKHDTQKIFETVICTAQVHEQPNINRNNKNNVNIVSRLVTVSDNIENEIEIIKEDIGIPKISRLANSDIFNANAESITQVGCTSLKTIDLNDPFAKHLLYPKIESTNSNLKKQCKGRQIPSAISSEAWRLHMEAKEKAKEQKSKEIATRKNLRKIAKENKELEKQKKTVRSKTTLKKKEAVTLAKKSYKNKTINIRTSKKRNRSESSEGTEYDDDDFCAVCGDNYYKSERPNIEWIQCVRCHKWLHYTCSDNPDLCPICTNKI